MSELDGFVRKVARRLGTQAALDATAGWLCLGLGAAVALVLAEQFLALAANVALLIAAPLLAAGLASVATALARWPAQHGAALAADARFGLAERLSTALAAGAGPMPDLVRRDALRHANSLDLRQALPVAPPRRSRLLLLLAIGLLIAILVPQMDLFGWGAARAARDAERAAIRQATDAARVGLANLAAAGRKQGLGRSVRTLEQIDRQLAGVASADTTAAKAREAARKAVSDLNNSRTENEDAMRTAEPAKRAELERERDLYVSAERVLEGWRREVAGEAQAGARPATGAKDGTKKGPDGPRERGPSYVRTQERPPVPAETAKVEERLVAARPAADSALRRDDVPWQYRGVVRRYFSPDDESEQR